MTDFLISFVDYWKCASSKAEPDKEAGFERRAVSNERGFNSIENSKHSPRYEDRDKTSGGNVA